MEEQGGSRKGMGKRNYRSGRRGNLRRVIYQMVGPGLPMADPTNLSFPFSFLLFFLVLHLQFLYMIRAGFGGRSGRPRQLKKISPSVPKFTVTIHPAAPFAKHRPHLRGCEPWGPPRLPRGFPSRPPSTALLLRAVPVRRRSAPSPAPSPPLRAPAPSPAPQIRAALPR